MEEELDIGQVGLPSPLWYICVTCNRAYQDDSSLTDHKESDHGIPRESKLAFLLSEGDLTPTLLLDRCKPSKRAQPRVADVDLFLREEDGSEESDSSENNSMDETLDVKPFLQVKVEMSVESDGEDSEAENKTRSRKRVNPKKTSKSKASFVTKKKNVVDIKKVKTKLKKKSKSSVQRKSGAVARKADGSRALSYECEYCGKVFSKSFVLKVHRRLHTNEMPYCCEICGKSFKWRSAYVYHKVTHSNLSQLPALKPSTPVRVSKSRKSGTDITAEYPNKLKCPIPGCEQMLRTRQTLGAHLRSVHASTGPVTCKDCQKTFSTKDSLKSHRRKKHNENAITILNRNAQDHNESGQLHSCSKCEEKFKFEFQLRHHILTMHQKKYSCDICQRRYENAWQLEAHKQEHEIINNSPLLCDHCGKSFACPVALKNHRRLVHDSSSSNSNVKLLECMHCGCLYNQLLTLVKHEESIHTPEELAQGRSSERYQMSSEVDSEMKKQEFSSDVKCKHCSRSFTLAHRLNHHIQLVHMRVHSCKLCPEKFKQKFQLVAHQVKIHGLKDQDDGEHLCVTCGRSYPTLFKLRFHTRVVHGNKDKFRCDACGRGFYLKTTLADHQKRCPICGIFPCVPVELKGHLKKDTDGSDTFECCHCHKSYKANTFLFHVKSHLNLTRPNGFICKVCGFETTDKGKHRYHMTLHKDKLRKGRSRCQFCDGEFYTTEVKEHRLHCQFRKCVFCKQTFDKNEVNIKSHRTKCKRLNPLPKFGQYCAVNSEESTSVQSDNFY